jgi:hypothetical protein
MSNLDDQITELRTSLARHVETFPTDNVDAWRFKFDELRADLERLEYAKDKRFHTAGSQSLSG